MLNSLKMERKHYVLGISIITAIESTPTENEKLADDNQTSIWFTTSHNGIVNETN